MPDLNREAVNNESWIIFCRRFKSRTTEASYRSDIFEFCRFTGKEFEDTTGDDVEEYYKKMTGKAAAGRISPLTVTKKFREMHSYSEFLISETQSRLKEDYFYPYLKNLAKESTLARAVPIQDMDAILKAASDDLMAYTILTLMYRAGLSSTEIAALNGPDDFFLYDDGMYVRLENREEFCHIPEDAEEILFQYMDQREEKESLFYNSRGARLNVMYISRMMKKYCRKAGTPSYSAESVRNCCAYNLFAYGASDTETAVHMGRTERQIRRYNGVKYRRNLRQNASSLVRIHIDLPE